ncbi:hypothetical protein B0J17DRAFT_451053 [Rhizoctonia solani]|nr:hypothetical protein B0J17DRAFT_451053 [Rhizoctonia solani]
MVLGSTLAIRTAYSSSSCARSTLDSSWPNSGPTPCNPPGFHRTSRNLGCSWAVILKYFIENLVITRNPFSPPLIYPPNMSLAPGIYTVHDPDSGRVLDCYGGSTRIGTWEPNQTNSQKSYPGSKCRPESLVYAFQSVQTRQYIPNRIDESGMHGANEPTTFHLEHGFQDFYLIRSARTKLYLCHPNVRPRQDEGYTPVGFAGKATLKGCVWRFERVVHETGGTVPPPLRVSHPATTSAAPRPSFLSFHGSRRLYPDDAHLYTDMLFNMPRMQFARDQRIAVLDWARRLGATNVPTIESLDECERRLEAALGGDNMARSE